MPMDKIAIHVYHQLHFIKKYSIFKSLISCKGDMNLKETKRTTTDFDRYTFGISVFQGNSFYCNTNIINN